jgi:hypothetical protein
LLIAALYHPPKPLYKIDTLYDYVEANCLEINDQFIQPYIIIAGDMNQLSDQELVERTGLIQIVDQPTRGLNKLDRIYVSDEQYRKVHVVTSTVRSDRKAVITHFDKDHHISKIVTRKKFRRKSPAQNAHFLQLAASVEFHCYDPDICTQAAFDNFYSVVAGLLETCYPERTATITSRDPDYVTPDLKSKLRRKNRLMRAGRIEEAGALAKQIGKDITRNSKSTLTRINGRSNAKEMWRAVNKFIGHQRQETSEAAGITAHSLNLHYADVSTDREYRTPPFKQTASKEQDQPLTYIEEWQIFSILDHLRPTAAGLDLLPAWFLRLAAPFISKPLAFLINKSLATSTVSSQWKTAWIKPIPKIAVPKAHADYRPFP